MKGKDHFSKRILLPALSLLFLFLSCKKEGGITGPSHPVKQMDSISNMYLMNLDGTGELALLLLGNTATNYFTHFSFQSGKIVARTGGFVNLFNSVYFVPLIYDTVIYNGNSVKIVTLTRDPSYTPSQNERDLLFSNGLLIKRTSATDTTYYYYSGTRLIKSIKYGKTSETTYNFSYDGQNNLTGLYQSSYNNYDSSEEGFARVNFTGFDQTSNPLKGFGLWDDLLIRSLSTNNFANVQYTKDSTVFGSSDVILHYDSLGNVDYSIP